MKNESSWVCVPEGACVLPGEKIEKKSGFEDIPVQEQCRHPEHNPPTHLYIPPGKRYRHVCPGCGQERVIQPPQISN